MGVYKKAVITDAGRAMMARSIAGEITINFSRVVRQVTHIRLRQILRGIYC